MASKYTLSIADTRKAIYNWIRKELAGVVEPDHIIWRDQSQALPARPCVTMKITSGPTRVGYGDNIAFVGGTTGSQFNVGGQRTMVLSIQVFGNSQISGPRAYQIATDLSFSLSKMTTLDSLRGSGIGILKQGDVTNITELEETEFEERGQFDVELSLADNVVDDPSIIEHVNITPDV